jgi:haloalkane dehalogenase
MPPVELRREGDIAYREAVPDAPATAPPVVLVHGFPESSRMWVALIERLAGEGRRCVAPDLYGLGDSTDDGPATFERNREAFTAWLDALQLSRVALVVHDWGGFIGLAWACEHPDAVAALVISDAGFFSRGRWHGMAEAIRGEQGEAIIAALDRDGFAGLLRAQSGGAFSDADVEAYWAPFADGRGRRATLEFYRSMDFEKLAPYDSKLAELGAPTLLLWGADDEFVRVSAAERFQRDIPDAKLVVIEDTGHFAFDQRPGRCADEVVSFLVAS